MVDFSTLRTRTAEEIARDDAERDRREFAADDRSRDEGSRKAVVVTLVHEPEFRTLPSGERLAILRGTEEGRTSPLAAVYRVPPRVERDERAGAAFDERMRALGGGDKVTLAGSWGKRFWNDQQGVRREAFEFKTQHFARGEMPLAKVLEMARSERGEGPVREPGRAAEAAARSAARGGMGG